MKEQKLFKDLEETVPGYEDDLQEQLDLFDKLEKIAVVSPLSCCTSYTS